MVFDKMGTTIIVSQKESSISVFFDNFKEKYETINSDNVIVDLTFFKELKTTQILKFLDISNEHRNSNKSFVLVSDVVSFEDIPEEICLVPTIQEAKDIIEMEEIERDLGL
ncbi:ribonuclease Z [Croceitalea vernalis]|uniref:Ribonuclease Z n=1 Tax=Croceitalea vernalis TaxID=3075599 RepID=A0ABU3BK93_9FLAO|nr:ribonuclease Z [Croceitalea sp. P007]MDT0622583.1 ribonuclease Z [Croceitalea sp. P007]